MQTRLNMRVAGRTAAVAAAALGLWSVLACNGTFQRISSFGGAVGGGGGGSTARDTSALVQLTLSPLAATVSPGGAVQYTVVGKLGDGTTTTPTAEFAVSGGGTITTAGLFTAGPTAGTELVIATQTGGPTGSPPCCTDTSVVTVTAASMVRALRGGKAP